MRNSRGDKRQHNGNYAKTASKFIDCIVCSHLLKRDERAAHIMPVTLNGHLEAKPKCQEQTNQCGFGPVNTRHQKRSTAPLLQVVAVTGLTSGCFYSHRP